jgi:hypothetical protein
MGRDGVDRDEQLLADLAVGAADRGKLGNTDGAGNTFTTVSLTLDVTGPLTNPVPPGLTNLAPPRLTNLVRPRVTRSRAALVCTPGRWSTATTSYSYRWLVDGKRKPRSTGKRLRVAASLHGHVIRCSVTASSGAGPATATSAPLRVR